MLQSITEYYRVLQSVTECYRVLQSVTECYRVLQSVTECYRVLQSITECYRVLQSITEYFRVLQNICSASTWTNFWACSVNKQQKKEETKNMVSQEDDCVVNDKLTLVIIYTT